MSSHRLIFQTPAPPPGKGFALFFTFISFFSRLFQILSLPLQKFLFSQTSKHETTIAFHALHGSRHDDGTGQGGATPGQHHGATDDIAQRRLALHHRRTGRGILRLSHEPHPLGILPQCQATAPRGSHRVRLRQGRHDAHTRRLEHPGRPSLLLRGHGVVQEVLPASAKVRMAHPDLLRRRQLRGHRLHQRYEGVHPHRRFHSFQC